MDDTQSLATPEDVSRPLSIRAANALLVITMILVVVVGSVVQTASLGWGLLITQFALILAPALLIVRLRRLPIREALRLNLPHASTLVISLVIGVGTTLVVLWWGAVVTELLGYTLPLPPEFFPRTWGPALLLLFGLVIAAPLCEEALFRGAVQHAYERRGPWFAILGVGLLFAIYHASLLRLFALIPVALLLGYVVWRTGSLWPGVALHLGYNAAASIPSTVDIIHPEMNLSSLGSFPGAPLLGLVVVLAGVVVLQRTPLARPTRTPPPERSVLGQTWPLLILVPIVLLLYAAEVVVGRMPELLALSRISLQPAPWTEPTRWRYELRNPLDEPIGSAVAEITPDEQGEYVHLRLSAQHDAFEAELPQSYFNLPEREVELTAEWFWDIGQLVRAEGTWREDDGTLLVNLARDQDALTMDVTPPDGAPATVPLPGDALVAAEWPWRLSSLGFGQAVASWQATLAHPNRYATQEADRDTGADDTVVTLYGSEPVSVPAGHFIAWAVHVEEQTAWYDVEAPHTLLQYDDGAVTYVLESVE